MSARHYCWLWFFRDARREFRVDDCGPRQRLIDQAIGKAGHRNPLRAGAEIQSRHEITPELRRIPFRSGHVWVGDGSRRWP